MSVTRDGVGRDHGIRSFDDDLRRQKIATKESARAPYRSDSYHGLAGLSQGSLKKPFTEVASASAPTIDGRSMLRSLKRRQRVEGALITLDGQAYRIKVWKEEGAGPVKGKPVASYRGSQHERAGSKETKEE